MTAKISLEVRKQQANSIHNGKYDYNKWQESISLATIVTIGCSTHGDFTQSLKSHIIHRSGCPKCAGRNVYTCERISQANQVHGGKYQYIDWPNTLDVRVTLLNINCPEHGRFQQTFNTHVHCRCGCPLCGPLSKLFTNNAMYHRRSHKQRHAFAHVWDKLNDSKWMTVQHIENKRSQLDIANELAVNPTTVGRYLVRHGIDKMYGQGSTGESQVYEFIQSLIGPEKVKSNVRDIISPYELDIYVPTQKIAIEYCGLYWHSEQAGKQRSYHQRKMAMCRKHGIMLITMFEDEWTLRQSQVKLKLASLLGVDHRPVVYARKTTIKPTSMSQQARFFEDNHIQGPGPGGSTLGLFDNTDTLVACASFIKSSNSMYTLSRYATSARVIGGMSKLTQAFMKNTPCAGLKSFADLRWGQGNMYRSAGWVQQAIIKPDYSYSLDAKTRHHKFNFRRKYLQQRLDVFDSTLSESDNCKINGVLKIWDCGKIRFIMPNTLHICNEEQSYLG